MKLAQKGTGIILSYRNNQRDALNVVGEIERYDVKATALALKIGDVSSFEAFVQEVQRQLKQVWQRDSFDYLINNAGIGLNASFAEYW